MWTLSCATPLASRTTSIWGDALGRARRGHHFREVHARRACCTRSPVLGRCWVGAVERAHLQRGSNPAGGALAAADPARRAARVAVPGADALADRPPDDGRLDAPRPAAGRV